MAEKGKGKKSPAKEETGVMSGLSATRPPRIGGRRRGAGTGGRAAAAGGDGAAPASVAKPASKRASTARAKRAAAPAKGASKSATAGAKPARKTAAKSAAKAAPKPAAPKPGARPAAAKPAQPAGMPSRGGVVRETPTRKPRPVRAGSPGLKRATAEAAKTERPPARSAPPPPPAGAPHAPSGTELVTTAIQAAGELAQIGVTVGGQILKRAIDRLPKP